MAAGRPQRRGRCFCIGPEREFLFGSPGIPSDIVLPVSSSIPACDPQAVFCTRVKSDRSFRDDTIPPSMAPMVSIARGASEQGLLKDKKLHFFYGGRSYKDVGVASQISDLPGFGQQIFFHPVVSDTSEDNLKNWSGEFGFVHELVEKKLGEGIKEYEFYFAGPPPMTKSLQETLMLKHQVPFEQIHFDRFF